MLPLQSPPLQRMLEHSAAQEHERQERQERQDDEEADDYMEVISPLSILSSKASSPNRGEAVRRMRQRLAAQQRTEDEEEEEEEVEVEVDLVATAAGESKGATGPGLARNERRSVDLAPRAPADSSTLCKYALQQAQCALKLVSKEGLTALALSSVITSASPATGDLQKRVCLQGLPSHVPREDALVLYATTVLLDSCTTARRDRRARPTGPTWAQICKSLSRPDDLIHALTHFDYDQVTPDTVAALYPFFSDPCYPSNVAARALPRPADWQTVYGLSIWCMSVEAYVTVAKGVAPSSKRLLVPAHARARSAVGTVAGAARLSSRPAKMDSRRPAAWQNPIVDGMINLQRQGQAARGNTARRPASAPAVSSRGAAARTARGARAVQRQSMVRSENLRSVLQEDGESGSRGSPAAAFAFSGVAQPIESGQAAELAAFAAPPAPVKKTMQILCILLGEPPTWSAAQRLLRQHSRLNAKMRATAETGSIVLDNTAKSRKAMRLYMSDPTCSPEVCQP